MATRSPAVVRVLAVVCALAFAMPAFAQVADGEDGAAAPAHIAFVDGDVTLSREGLAERAIASVPLVSGDRLATGQGRAEVIFGDGSVLDVDHFTSIDFLSDELVRLLEGRVRLEVGGRDSVSYRIDTPSGAVRIESPGEYRVSLIGASGAADVELVAIRGGATLLNEFGETYVRAGERAVASVSLAPSYAQDYNSARWDAFDAWVEDRRDERLGSASARYLPEDVRGYAGEFDRYGDWRYEHDYGYVWYPRVHVSWRPYYYGRWNWFGPWGWTWISYDRWGWPTHHYGRWGFRAGVWFWIPTRRWAPAWVYWASAPGYVGWCPLGWNNRPVFNIINVNVVNLRRGYDPYHGWTVVPRHSFGTRVAVERHAVPRDRLRHAVPRWTVQAASAPVRPAVERRTAVPIYSAGRPARSRARTGGATAAAAPSQGATAAGRARAAVPRGTAAAGSRAPGGVVTAPRATLPPSPAALDRGGRSTPARGTARSRTRYRDLGPGGSSPPEAAPGVARTPDPGTRGIPSRRRPDADWSPGVAAPAAPGARDERGRRAAPRYSPPPLGDERPGARQGRGDDRGGSRSGDGMYRPRGGDRDAGPRAVPRSAPRTTSPRGTERQSGGGVRAPSNRGGAPGVRGGAPPPSGGGGRARSRQAPSGGSQPSGSGGSESRRAKPRPRPQ